MNKTHLLFLASSVGLVGVVDGSLFCSHDAMCVCCCCEGSCRSGEDEI